MSPIAVLGVLGMLSVVVIAALIGLTIVNADGSMLIRTGLMAVLGSVVSGLLAYIHTTDSNGAPKTGP